MTFAYSLPLKTKRLYICQCGTMKTRQSVRHGSSAWGVESVVDVPPEVLVCWVILLMKVVPFPLSCQNIRLGESDRGSVKTPALKRRERTKPVCVRGGRGKAGRGVVLLPALFQSASASREK